ncbi:MAG: hypothetical protein IJU20_05075 [Clostridia bacterium]|nr:hypothetical protein [Clostridia bacterium]
MATPQSAVIVSQKPGPVKEKIVLFYEAGAKDAPKMRQKKDKMQVGVKLLYVKGKKGTDLSNVVYCRYPKPKIPGGPMP